MTRCTHCGIDFIYGYHVKELRFCSFVCFQSLSLDQLIRIYAVAQ